MLDAAQTELALLESTVAFRGERDVVTVSGPDAASYLQGQVSQEIEGLEVGESAWSLVLQPQGKVDGWFRVTRMDAETFVLDLDVGFGPAVLARLERFKLRTNAEFTLETMPWLAVRGPASSAPEGAQPLALDWPGVTGFDLLGHDVDAGSVPIGDQEVFEASRIRSGIPAHGRELTDKTIPAEVGIVDRSVSFTKGCYVGQELVARVDSRGNNTPRNLTGVRIGGTSLPAESAELRVDGEAAGRLTSLGQSASLGAVALAYVKRGTAVPGPATLTLTSGEEVQVELTTLPF